MKKNYLLLLALITLMLVSMSCKISFDFPVQDISTSEDQNEVIQIASPGGNMADVKLEFGAGELSIRPGGSDFLVSGTAIYNVPEFKPIIEVENSHVSLETGTFEIGGIPNIGNMDDLKNKWDLTLGTHPMNLRILAGAYTGDYELGSLSIKNLEISDGASDVTMRFSNPNLVAMDSLRYTTGASNVKLYGLGYANFSSMIFRGGAGDYQLDFSGGLLRDSVVTIEAGVSQVTLVVPKSINAIVLFKGGLANVDVSDAWKKSGDRYELSGSGPVITINVDMGAGTLNLKTSEEISLKD